MEPEQIVDAAILERRRKDAARKKLERAARKQRAQDKIDLEIAQYFDYYQLIGVGQLTYGDALEDFARSEEEHLFCAARFAKAGGLSTKILANDSLNSYEARIFGALCERRPRTGDFAMPYLSLKTGKFDERFEVVYPVHFRDSRIYIAEFDAPLIARGIVTTGVE